jgi:hypothetical protein
MRALTGGAAAATVWCVATRRAKWALLAVLWSVAAGCEGGQTGQPSPASSCRPEPTTSWRGKAVRDWVAPFEGQHRGRVQWLAIEPGSSIERSVDLEDFVTIDVRYDAELGVSRDCGWRLSVPVFVRVHTEASALDDRAEGRLELDDGGRGTLTMSGRLLSLSVELGEVSGGAPPHGRLYSLVEDAPGAAADVGELPSDSERNKQ